MISGVARSFASVTIIRILSRILQFVLRVYLIRSVLSPEILAEMVALDLIMTTSLHIAKSCFKPSYQQVESKDKRENVISSMNLMSIGVVTTLLSAIVVIALQWHHKIELKYVNETVIMYGICSVIQALKEKFSVEFVLGYQYRKIALIELVSYLPKTLVVFIAAKTGLFQTYGILVFGVGHILFYGLCLFLTFYLTNYKIIFVKSFKSMTSEKEGEPNQIQNQEVYLDKKTKKVLKQLSYISILKLFLQQFQKIVLVVNNAVQDSSIYSLVSNLGSIIVRFFFAPLQQIAYNFYARGSQQQSKDTLITIVKVIFIFSLACLGFGCRYAENVLEILYGHKWVTPDSVMAFQCFMILISIMGLNGAIDSFVIARADPVKTIPKIKYLNVLSTLIYFGSSFLFLHFSLGAGGLFLGNAVGMLSKIIINWNLQINKHISLREFFTAIKPNNFFIGAFVFCLIISYQIKNKIDRVSPIADLAIGVILFGISALPILYQYKKQIKTFIVNLKFNMRKIQ